MKKRSIPLEKNFKTLMRYHCHAQIGKNSNNNAKYLSEYLETHILLVGI